MHPVGSSGRVCAALVLAALMALTACSSGPDVEAPRPGTALEAGPSDSLLEAELPPGQEVVQLVEALRNASDAPLEITKLRGIPGGDIPDAAQVVQVAVVPPGSQLEPGLFVTYPPVTRANGECVRAEVRPGRGLTLAPGEEPLVLVWLRTLAPGRATVTGFRVSYEQEGTLYEQEVPIDGSLNLLVRMKVETVKPSPDERACASLTRLLPGAVTI